MHGGPLRLDPILTGTVRTHATNSRVTDSASSATAYATGVKTYNGAIGVDSSRAAVATLLEAAEAAGMATGLVATSRITHATPASFAAHVPSRGMETEIAAQMMSKDIEVILGGGRAMFVPQSDGGRREAGDDLIAAARADGYAFVDTPDALAAVTDTPLLGLFADSHLDYEVDRDPADQPSLADLTAKALALLQDDADGFFLVIEGSRIDHAAHSNDPVGMAFDAIAFDAAVGVALDFAERAGNTLIVSTADHETGGLTLGRDGIYAWQPLPLTQVNASLSSYLGRVMDGEAPLAAFEAIADFDLTDEERQRLADAEGTDEAGPAYVEIISARAGLGWTTTGHTAVDVNLYAFGPGHHLFRGNVDNTAIGRRLATLLGFDLDALTEQLRRELALGTEDN